MEAIRDFRTYRPDAGLSARMEYDRMGGRSGRKYDLNALPVRAALGRWKAAQGIPAVIPLSEAERLEFEVWLTGERMKAKEKAQ